MPFKLIAVIFVVVAAAAGGGWLAGASGRSIVEQERQHNEMRAEYAESRALVLDGRVSLYQSNFGDAIKDFQDARQIIGHLQVELREMGQINQAGRLEIVLSHLSDAQQATAAFDAARAHAATDQAMQALTAASS